MILTEGIDIGSLEDIRIENERSIKHSGRRNELGFLH